MNNLFSPDLLAKELGFTSSASAEAHFKRYGTLQVSSAPDLVLLSKDKFEGLEMLGIKARVARDTVITMNDEDEFVCIFPHWYSDVHNHGTGRVWGFSDGILDEYDMSVALSYSVVPKSNVHVPDIIRELRENGIEPTLLTTLKKSVKLHPQHIVKCPCCARDIINEAGEEKDAEDTTKDVPVNAEFLAEAQIAMGGPIYTDCGVELTFRVSEKHIIMEYS